MTCASLLHVLTESITLILRLDCDQNLAFFSPRRVITLALYVWSCHDVTGSRKVRITFLSTYMGDCAAQMLWLKRDNLPASRVCNMHWYHASHKHFLMHSSISPMAYAEVLIHTRPFHSSKAWDQVKRLRSRKGSTKSRSRV